MAFISIHEYLEQKRKQIHNEAADDHWYTDSIDNDCYMYPYVKPWHATDACMGVVSSMVEQ